MERKTLLQTSRFAVEQLVHATGDGLQHTKEIIRHPGAATIIPMVDDHHVCLIKNYRVSVDRTLIELPAGTLEPPERPEVTAHRELIEETGFAASNLQLLHEFYLSPGILDERMHLFLATGLTAGDAAREAGELIENLVVPFSEAIQMAIDGRIQDAKTIVGLLIYDRMRGSLGR